MGQFEPTTVADWIGLLLVVGVALWGGWQMLTHYLDNAPFMEDEPARYPVHPWHASNLLSEMQSLRTPLPQHRNQTQPADDWEELLAMHGVCAEDRVDIIRGSKLP